MKGCITDNKQDYDEIKILSFTFYCYKKNGKMDIKDYYSIIFIYDPYRFPNLMHMEKFDHSQSMYIYQTENITDMHKFPIFKEDNTKRVPFQSDELKLFTDHLLKVYDYLLNGGKRPPPIEYGIVTQKYISKLFPDYIFKFSFYDMAHSYCYYNYLKYIEKF